MVEHLSSEQKVAGSSPVWSKLFRFSSLLKLLSPPEIFLFFADLDEEEESV